MPEEYLPDLKQFFTISWTFFSIYSLHLLTSDVGIEAPVSIFLIVFSGMLNFLVAHEFTGRISE